MKKREIKIFGLGMVVGIAITMLCGVVILRKPDVETNLAKESFYSEDTNSNEVDYHVEEKEIDSTETDNITSNSELEEINTSITTETDDDISSNSDFEDKDTSIITEKDIVCDKAIEAYMSGQWDGTEMQTPEGYTIKLCEGGGYLLIDGYIADSQVNLDIPKSAYQLFSEDIPDYEYVPGQGTYVIIDKKLVKFLRGEQIELSGGKLLWQGFQDKADLNAKVDIDSRMMYNLPKLIYNKIDGKLYLTSGDSTCTLDNSENYVYVFDDCNISRIWYIGRLDFEHQYPGNVDMQELIAKSKRNIFGF